MAEKVEDLKLPNSVVTRLIKNSLPESINVSKEARTAIARAASVFVLYLTSYSNGIAMKNNRKTISANDLFKALEETEFDLFIEPLKKSLEAHKKFQLEKKMKGKKPEDAKAEDNETLGEEDENEEDEEVEEDEETED